MNTLEIKTLHIHGKYGDYDNECLLIDGKPLHDYLSGWYQQNGWGELPYPLAPGLAVTLNGTFDFEGDARFMREMMQKDRVNLPVLSCPEDMDFSCVVVIAETEKTEDAVYWHRIGKINHSIENFEEEKQHGILFVDNFTDEEWNRYADAAFWNTHSPEWKDWIAKNWSEELFRRRMNYTYLCYHDERNIDWIFPCEWCFDRKQYDALMMQCHPHEG